MRTDILLDDNNKLLIKNGDFVIGPSDQQHIDLIISSEKGEWRRAPWLGFAIKKRLKAVVSRTRFERELKVELGADGYINPAVETNNDLSIFKVEI